MEAVRRVNRGSCSHANLRRGWVHLKRVPPHQHGKCRDCLEQSKLITNTLAPTAAEGQVGKVLGGLVWGALGGVEAGGVEAVGVAPVLRAPVQVPHADENICALRHLVAANDVVLQGATDEHGRLGVEAHGLVQAPGGPPQGLQVLQGGLPVPQNAVHLGLQAGGVLGVLRQAIQRPRQHRGGGLVPRDQQRHQVVPQLLAVNLVAAGQQEVQDAGVPLAHELLRELLVLRLHQLLALADELVQGGVHDGHGLRAAALTRHQRTQQRNVPVGDGVRAPVLRLPQCRVHRLDDRVIVSEAVEVVVKNSLPNDVQCQPGEQVLHLNRLPSFCCLV
mmetsp:Transcript_14219/g.42949  ORF Transcript_14219/g.42949 Transcript_14219/m.42949 type:complete len:333 (-) Transcript_14219:1210-2208(-)